MLAVGDALALVVSRMKGLRRRGFRPLSPRRLPRAASWPRWKNSCVRWRTAAWPADRQTVREVFVHLGRPGRRTGAIMLVDGDGRLSGIFTDSDLARLFEANRDAALDHRSTRS